MGGDYLRASVHVGPKGGTEYRLWKSADIYVVAGRYKAWPLMDEAERSKAESMEAARKAKRKAEAEHVQWCRSLRMGR